MTHTKNAPELITDNFSDSMTIATAAAKLGCNISTVRAMIFKGELKAYRVGSSGRLVRILNSDFAALWKPLAFYNGD